MRFFTPKEDKFLRDNYLVIPAKRMSKMLGRSESSARQRMKLLGIIVPPEVAEKFKQDGYIKKGNVPQNKGKKQTEWMTKEGIRNCRKTTFKKGNVPSNAKPKDGVISLRKETMRNGQVRMYKWIRVGLGKWKMYHVYKWEKKHGKIPAGHIIVFKDKDSMNCKYSNLEMITLSENMKRNSYHTNLPKPLALAVQLRGALNRQINKHIKRLKDEK